MIRSDSECCFGCSLFMFLSKLLLQSSLIITDRLKIRLLRLQNRCEDDRYLEIHLFFCKLKCINSG